MSPKLPSGKRRAKPVKRSPVKRRNAKRAKKNFERSYGVESGKLAWVKDQRCYFCGIIGYTEAAHATTGGMGRKADASTLIPMCGPWDTAGNKLTMRNGKPHIEFYYTPKEGCHAELHRVGRKTFEAKYDEPLTDIAARYEAEFQALGGPPETEPE